jgi:hypothetical protein
MIKDVGKLVAVIGDEVRRCLVRSMFEVVQCKLIVACVHDVPSCTRKNTSLASSMHEILLDSFFCPSSHTNSLLFKNAIYRIP